MKMEKLHGITVGICLFCMAAQGVSLGDEKAFRDVSDPFADPLPTVFTLLDGREFTEVTLVDSGATWIKIAHSEGVSRIPVAQLPKELREAIPKDYKREAEELEERQQARVKAAMERSDRAVAAAEHRLKKAIKGAAIVVQGRISQVVDAGLALVYVQELRYQSVEAKTTLGTSAGVKKVPYFAAENADPVAVLGLSSGYVDGDRLGRLTLYPCGVFSYTMVSGGKKTVRRYAVSAELARLTLVPGR